ncbi:MAG: replication initiator protein A [Oscillospiraceae bacterium]|nr:replication initiator protein A [Oscillospiraceae bacterium]
MSLELDYFYGNEAEQYSFYRIPKTLFTDRRFKSVSMEAKVLYGLMLDRMGLSIRNGWLDKDGKVYIYFTLEDAVEMLDSGKDKVIRLFKELDKPNGIGLIERRKQGQGKPTRIYVMNFTVPPEPEQLPPATLPTPPVQTSEFPKSGLREGAEVLTSEKPKSRLRKQRGQDFAKPDTNKTDKNDTELSDTESSIYPPAPTPPPHPRRTRSRRDRMDQMDAYRALICENISYDLLLQEKPYEQDLLDCYVELMVETCCTGRETIRVNQEDVPADVVRSRLLKLEKEHIEYVMECLSNNTTLIGNIRAYTLSALYNAPVTIGQYYASQVAHDMAQGVMP